jgi:hypothetical protein
MFQRLQLILIQVFQFELLGTNQRHDMWDLYGMINSHEGIVSHSSTNNTIKCYGVAWRISIMTEV